MRFNKPLQKDSKTRDKIRLFKITVDWATHVITENGFNKYLHAKEKEQILNQIIIHFYEFLISAKTFCNLIG